MRRHRHLLLPLSALLTLYAAACGGRASGDVPQPSPEVAITYPEQGAIIDQQRIRVRGTARHVEEVLVNGKPASVVGGRWELELAFAEGEVSATVEARRVTQQVTFTVDATAPTLVISSPARAAFIPASEPQLQVTGRVTERGSGLSLLKVNEQIITPDAEGAFSHTITLAHGLNTIDVSAIDRAGHTAQHLIGVMHGEFADPATPIRPAVDLLVDRRMFGKISKVVAALITPERVKALAATNIPIEGVSLTDISFDPIELVATPRSNTVNPDEPGFITFDVRVTHALIKGTFMLSGEEIALDVMLDEAQIATSMTLRTTPEGSLDISFGTAELTLPPGALSWVVRTGSGELSNDDSRLLTNLVEQVAQYAFSDLLSDQIIEQLYDPNLLKRRVELLGRTLAIELRLDELITNASGLFIRASILLPEQPFAEIPEHPGALNTPRGARSASGLTQDAIATTDAHTINRLLHGAWTSGLLNQRLVGADFAGFELPVQLEAGALALVIDGQVLNHADSSSPAGIALRPQLPPIISLSSPQEASEGDEDGTLITARIAELHVDLLLDVTTTPKKLATLALFLDLGVTLGITPENQLTLDLTFSGASDLIDEPLFDLDDAEIERLMESVFALVPGLLADQLVLGGDADITWLTLSAPELVVHGLLQDELSIGLNVDANLAGLEDL